MIPSVGSSWFHEMLVCLFHMNASELAKSSQHAGSHRCMCKILTFNMLICFKCLTTVENFNPVKLRHLSFLSVSFLISSVHVLFVENIFLYIADDTICSGVGIGFVPSQVKHSWCVVNFNCVVHCADERFVVLNCTFLVASMLFRVC